MKLEEIPLDFWPILGVTILHLLSCHMVLAILKREKELTFQEIGRPHLFLNNTPSTSWLFTRWLYGSWHKDLSVLGRTWAWIAQVTGCVGLTWFLVRLVLFMFSIPS